MYRLAKELGKLVNNLRTIANDSAMQWRETLDNELAFKEIQEIKKSAQELQDAFSWRQDRCARNTRGSCSETPTPSENFRSDRWRGAGTTMRGRRARPWTRRRP